ncbi:DUF378 domain-containing protein [Siminovitchia acidinfaciens]|uniref:DUF378 domain-containing protein n=1 Tax=Siminovitchia acidinfaciens TaxID=2321395 RepID=A0A429XTD4_9BACI|nr:DUF378 domain-containing protein [Siminovitchia acidinfaciens]RST70978.1 DUF378 domain-containing protein [Siminovitchia acidinfaciens]VEF46062.1 Domain of uncharacterised function (DUF378) [Bacillus freudenreichii]
MSTLRKIALALTIIGALNWGLIGLFRFDLVAAIFGGQTAGLSRLIYTLVGLSGLICLSYFFDRETAGAGANERRNTQTTVGQPNYGTEFAEDPDLDLAYNPSRDEYEKKEEE